MSKLNLNTAEATRVKLTRQQEKHIAQVYKRASAYVAKKARNLSNAPSSSLYRMQLNQLKKDIDKQLKAAEESLKQEIQSNMTSVAEAVISDNQEFLNKIGLSIDGAYHRVPEDIIKSVTTGQLYEGNWSLSRALWKDHMKTQHDINTVVAEGIASNKGAYDIAKDLEKYLNPDAKKDWDWNKVYPGTRRKVDYSAQRLARTMVSHAYQQSFVRTTQNNPFVLDYVWISSGGERMCEICASRDGEHYPKDKLPLDHPNGMCTFEAELSGNMTEIADRLADWANGGSDPDIDSWIKSIGVDPEKLPIIQQQVSNPYGFNRISGSHTARQDAEMSNPYYFKGSSYRNNCQRCVPTFELRRRGFDVIAKPKSGKDDPVFQNWYGLFKDTSLSDWSPLKAKRKSKQADEIRSMLTNWGIGSRAEIYVKWDGVQSAHVFAAECQKDGSVVFIDPQNGLAGSPIERYFEECMPSRTLVLRIDNRELSSMTKDICESTPQSVNEAHSKGAGNSVDWKKLLKET